jgi:homoserine kinase
LTWSQRPATVHAPATSANLGPGFDALGLALRLRDQVSARVTSGGLAVEVSGEGGDTAGAGERHLVVRAMRAAFDALGGQPPGLALRCVNAIPHGRGLGSSAAAICSGLLAARALTADGGRRLPDQALFRLAVHLEGHPDNVAACLAGGLTIAWAPHRGPASPEEAGAGPAGASTAGASTAARLLRLPVLARLRVVACVPPEPLATAAARRALPARVPLADAAANGARTALLVAALTRAPDLLFDATEDFLHQPYRAAVMPATASLVGRLREAGFAAVVSGAGPSVLVLSSAGDGQPASAVGSIATSTGITWRVTPLEVDRQGARVQQRGMDVHLPDSGRRRPSRLREFRPHAGQAGWSRPDQPASCVTYPPPSRECRGLCWC